jgi:hypothetical protein
MRTQRLSPVHLARALRWRLRALADAAGRSYNRLESRWFDRRRHVDTAGKASMAEMGAAEPLVDHGTGYQGCNAYAVRRVFRRLDIPHDRCLVDIGSGKGKVLILALEHGFASVVGVEPVESLNDIARSNLRSLGYADERFDVRNDDVRTMDLDAIDVFFLNNPFDAAYFEAFLENLGTSLARRPRDSWIIYFNPVSAATIDARPEWQLLRRFPFFGPGRDGVVYAHRA